MYHTVKYNIQLSREIGGSPKISTSEKLQNKDKIAIKYYTQLIDVLNKVLFDDSTVCGPTLCWQLDKKYFGYMSCSRVGPNPTF